MFIKWLFLCADLVDGLRHAEHLALVVLDRHAQDAVCFVSGLRVDLVIKPWILQGTKLAGHMRHWFIRFIGKHNT